MSRGVPLTEADREPWLQALRRLLLDLEARGQSGLLACSALTAAFREALTEGVETAQFVHLAGSFDLILDRIKARAGHYMKAEMLASQFEALEPPDHVLTVPVDQPPEAIAGQIVDALGLEAT